jgi:hypothetical protein
LAITARTLYNDYEFRMATIPRCSLAFAFLAVLITASAVQVRAQSADADDPANAAKGADLLRKATEARGGSHYLAFKSVITSGQYTPFDEKGVSTIPVQFTDYLVYPDKERTDFGKGRKKDRQDSGQRRDDRLGV